MKNILIILISILFLLPQITFSQACMEATSEDGVNVIGYIQPQYEHSFLGTDLNGHSLDESKFYFRRARLGVTGNIPYDFSYYAVAELSPAQGGASLLDAFISYNRWDPYLKISVGQFRTPFGLELSTPCHKLHTINRSLVVGNLSGPFRDMGVMISGSTDEKKIFGLETKDLLSYQIAIVQGTGLNTLDNNRAKDILGRVAIHPFDFITVGTSYRFGKHPTLVTDAPEDERSRIGIDLTLEHKGFMVQGEYISGSDVGSYTTGGGCGDELTLHEGSVNRNGFMVMAMYKTKWNLQPVIKYETYDPNMDVTARENPDFIIQNTITYGLNYFFNEKTRVQINYLYNAEENGNVEVPNDALLVQFQTLF